MSFPSERDIQTQLLRLLASAPGACLHCQDVYRRLAEKFPQLTDADLHKSYEKSGSSKWMNLVQRARQHLVEQHHIYSPNVGAGRGYWMLTEAGMVAAGTVELNEEIASRLLAELDTL
jgi:hypothetical protein